jgi:hypothetical protein
MHRVSFAFCALIFPMAALALPLPVVLEPAEGAVISGEVLTVKWQPLDAGHWAQIQVASDVAFTQILTNADRLTGTEWQYHALPQDGKRYYWRIRSRAVSDNPDEGEPYPDEEGETPDPTDPTDPVDPSDHKDPVDPIDPGEGERPGVQPPDKSGGCGTKSWIAPKELLSDWLEWNFSLW